VTSDTSEPDRSPGDRSGATIEPSWWQGRAQQRRARVPLTRDAIVDAAIRIVDADGVDALTIRRLAEALGTGAATVYWYVRGKEELAQMVYDRVMGEVVLPGAPDPEHWEEQIKALGRECYRVMRGHRDIARLSLGRVPVGPNMLRIMEWSLDLLRRAGIPDDLAGYFGDIFGRFLDASVLEDVSAPSEQTPEHLARIRDHFAALPVAEYPNLTALAATLFSPSPEERFEFGLDVLVRGLAEHAGAAR
jgi:AcrR family transcriptional regulator